MEFTVKIRLGNDAMQTPENIAFALAGVAFELESVMSYTDPVADAIAGKIKDGNGNIVGEWSIQ